MWALQTLGPRVVSWPLLGPVGHWPPRQGAGDARRGQGQPCNVSHAPVYLRRWRVLQSDQVHLDAEVLEQQLPWDATHRVERVVGVRMGRAWGRVEIQSFHQMWFSLWDKTCQEKISEVVAVNLLNLESRGIAAETMPIIQIMDQHIYQSLSCYQNQSGTQWGRLGYAPILDFIWKQKGFE